MNIEIIVLVWIACAGLAAMLVPEEKRLEAAIWGFLLGPLGVIIVALKFR